MHERGMRMQKFRSRQKDGRGTNKNRICGRQLAQQIVTQENASTFQYAQQTQSKLTMALIGVCTRVESGSFSPGSSLLTCFYLTRNVCIYE